MNKTPMPQANDWNRYWGSDQTQQFTKISWSKKRIIEVLRPYIRQGYCALDAGCGSGFFSKFFCDQGMRTTSLDYSKEALDIAREKTNGRAALVCSDLLKDDLEKLIDEKFHIIFTDGLFEHFTDEQQGRIFTNLVSVLDSGGVVVTFVPNRFSPWELIRPFYMPGIKEDPFTLNQLVRLNCRNGKTVIKSGGLNTFPFRFSPDKVLGNIFGMLLYTISK